MEMECRGRDSNPHLLDSSSMFAADCRKLDGSAAEAYLDLLSADHHGHYALAVRQAHDLFDGLGIVFSADFLIGHAALLEVLLGCSAVGATGLGVDNNFLWHCDNLLPLVCNLKRLVKLAFSLDGKQPNVPHPFPIGIPVPVSGS